MPRRSAGGTRPGAPQRGGSHVFSADRPRRGATRARLCPTNPSCGWQSGRPEAPSADGRGFRRTAKFDLIIVGEGPERAAIGALARELRLADRIRLLGRVPQDHLSDIYTAADLLLLVSTSEGWPNVLLESMACGTSVIVSDIDGIADIVAPPEAGCILPEATPSRIAAAVRAFFAAPPDRAATRAYAERFNWQSTTEGQIALFHKMCRRRARRNA
jgi:glycosyltransferase involved in cell wall biosynthesis